MKEPEDGSMESEGGKESGYVHADLPEDGHIRFRRCAACGAEDMRPSSSFVSSGLGGATERGLDYRCPACGAEAKIQDSGAFFMGAIYALFWGAVALWAFYAGPLWYIRHPSYFAGEGAIWYLPLDFGLILLCLAVIAFSGWFIWIILLGPLKTLIQHPVTNENRAKTGEEAARDRASRRMALMSFFVYPLFLWAPLLGVFWGLDALGVDIQGNELVKYAGIAAVLGLVVALGKRYGANVAYAVAGMVFWLAIFVTLIFTL